MPPKTKKACKHRGCPNVTTGTYCEQHKDKKWKKESNDAAVKIRKQGNAVNFVYIMRSECFVRQNGLCAICKKPLTSKFELDHIKPHRGDPELFYDRENVQDVCIPCHRIKTGGGE